MRARSPVDMPSPLQCSANVAAVCSPKCQWLACQWPGKAPGVGPDQQLGQRRARSACPLGMAAPYHVAFTFSPLSPDLGAGTAVGQQRTVDIVVSTVISKLAARAHWHPRGTCRRLRWPPRASSRAAAPKSSFFPRSGSGAGPGLFGPGGSVWRALLSLRVFRARGASESA